MGDQLIQWMANDHFPDPLELREIGNGKWELLRDFRYIDDYAGEILVPAGAVTDFYSVPLAVRSIVSAMQKSNAPAVIHDWCYRAQVFGAKGKKQADRVLERAMRDHWAPVSWWQRKKIITGLKIGGWIAYRNARQKYEQLTFLLGRLPTDQDVKNHMIP